MADPRRPERDDEYDRPRPFGPLALVVIAALVVGGWLLIQRLSADSKMQDCIGAGRRNCAPIEAP